MKHVGVAVEGPSDRVFWDRVFGRHFVAKGYRFDIRSMNGRDRLIREAPYLSDDFKSAGYEAAFFIMDADEVSCPLEIFDLFDESFRNKATSLPIHDRFHYICISVRELESWVMADEVCMRELLVAEKYGAPSINEPPSGKAKLLRLCKQFNVSPAGLKDREFARQAAGAFDPERARQHSKSFSHCWERISLRLA